MIAVSSGQHGDVAVADFSHFLLLAIIDFKPGINQLLDFFGRRQHLSLCRAFDREVRIHRLVIF